MNKQFLGLADPEHSARKLAKNAPTHAQRFHGFINRLVGGLAIYLVLTAIIFVRGQDDPGVSFWVAISIQARDATIWMTVIPFALAATWMEWMRR
ncbi:MAG: hypothetical protein AAGH38_00470 [Pseudomonadota bacterium]